MFSPRLLLLPLLASASLALSCGEAQEPPMTLSQQPVSVRGWIGTVGAPPEPGSANETFDATRKINTFRASAVSVDNVPWASGGLAENGSFIILDVPPGDFTLLFQIEDVGDVRLSCRKIPGNADVFIPGLVIRPEGVDVADPAAIRVRVPGEERKSTNLVATVGSHSVPVVEVPLNELLDRRDYPQVPGMEKGPAAIGVTIQR